MRAQFTILVMPLTVCVAEMYLLFDYVVVIAYIITHGMLKMGSTRPQVRSRTSLSVMSVLFYFGMLCGAWYFSRVGVVHIFSVTVCLLY